MSVEHRLAVRELVDAYAQRVDHADGPGAAALFTEDGTLHTPTSTLQGRAAITAAINGLSRYQGTLHVIASHVAQIDGDHGTGETRCIAHHLTEQDDRVMFIRYDETYARVDGVWLFATRTLDAYASGAVPRPS